MDTTGFYTDRSGIVPVIRSSLITVPHGFSTREGGVSNIPHLASLNLGFDLGDTIDNVLENRRRFFSSALKKQTAADQAVFATQIHSDIVTVCEKKDLSRNDLFLDGFVTDVPGVPLFVRTADCCPLLFSDPVHRVIGSCHAGWRGTIAGIARKTVEKMCSLGASAEDIRCVIGPCIHVCCYEVGDDFVRTVRKAVSPALADLCLIKWEDGRYHADLTSFNCHILLSAGLSEDHVGICPECTASNPTRFFSHRASRGKRGLCGGIIMLEEE